MRKQRAEHPSWTQDILKLFGWITGRKVCLDAKGDDDGAVGDGTSAGANG